MNLELKSLNLLTDENNDSIDTLYNKFADTVSKAKQSKATEEVIGLKKEKILMDYRKKLREKRRKLCNKC